MDARPEGQVLAAQLGQVAIEPELVGVFERLLVAVGRGVEHHHLGVFGDDRAVALDLGTGRPEQPEYGRVEPQALLDDQLGERRVGAECVPPAAVLQEAHDRVGDERRGRLVAPHEELVEHAEQLGIVDRPGCLLGGDDQAAHEVVGELLTGRQQRAAAGHLDHEVVAHLGPGLEVGLRIAPTHHRDLGIGPALEGPEVVLGHAQHAGDGDHGQRAGEPVVQVAGRPLCRHRVEQLVGQDVDRRLRPLDGAWGERAQRHAAEHRVTGRIVEHAALHLVARALAVLARPGLDVAQAVEHVVVAGQRVEVGLEVGEVVHGALGPQPAVGRERVGQHLGRERVVVHRLVASDVLHSGSLADGRRPTHMGGSSGPRVAADSRPTAAYEVRPATVGSSGTVAVGDGGASGALCPFEPR